MNQETPKKKFLYEKLLTPDDLLNKERSTATTLSSRFGSLDNAARELEIEKIVMEGHIPSSMLHMTDVTFTFRGTDGVGHVMTIHVLNNYLSIGSDDDQLIVPLWPTTAQRLCDVLDCTLPTTKLVDVIWSAAPVRLEPLPWGPPYDASMQSTKRILAHNVKITTQVNSLVSPAREYARSRLVAGHKKDVVITNRLERQPKQVAIYGWHKKDGKPIQPLYLGHENEYCDYSHGIRLISNACVLDGAPWRTQDIMVDPVLNVGPSNEGIMKVLKQP